MTFYEFIRYHGVASSKYIAPPRPSIANLTGRVFMGLRPTCKSMNSPVGRASSPAAFGGTGFQPVRRTGKMPVPPKTFPGSTDNEDGGQCPPYR